MDAEGRFLGMAQGFEHAFTLAFPVLFWVFFTSLSVAFDPVPDGCGRGV